MLVTVLSGFHTRESYADEDLRQATLNRAVFKMCNFSGANLRGASMRGTRFSGCDFRGADLRDADLTNAVFDTVKTHDPNYGRCDLTGARLDGAVTKGLTAVQVVGAPDAWIADRP